MSYGDVGLKRYVCISANVYHRKRICEHTWNLARTAYCRTFRQSSGTGYDIKSGFSLGRCTLASVHHVWRTLGRNFAGGALSSSVRDYRTEQPILPTHPASFSSHQSSRVSHMQQSFCVNDGLPA